MPTHLARVEMYDLYHALDRVRPLLSNMRAAYTLGFLRKELKPFVENFDDLHKPKEDFQEYSKLKDKLCGDHAKKNAGGEPVMLPQFDARGRQVAQKFDIDPEKSEAFQKAMEKLNKEHKKAIDGYNDQIKEINDFMKEPLTEIDVEKLPKIPLSAFKKDAQDGGAFDFLWPIIHNDDEELAAMLTSGVVKAEGDAAEKPAAPAPAKVKVKAK